MVPDLYRAVQRVTVNGYGNVVSFADYELCERIGKQKFFQQLRKIPKSVYSTVIDTGRVRMRTKKRNLTSYIVCVCPRARVCGEKRKIWNEKRFSFASAKHGLLFWRRRAERKRVDEDVFSAYNPRRALWRGHRSDGVKEKKNAKRNSNTTSPQVGGSAMNNNNSASATRPRDAHRPTAAVILVPSQGARNVRDAATRRTRKKTATGGRVKFQITNT